ncbi:MAG: tetratricopeptide repeat protein [Deltaproteobacteria bacterium]|nr:tetratricopeptide repeat protein [Deltaproteobacteria bacterium]
MRPLSPPSFFDPSRQGLLLGVGLAVAALGLTFLVYAPALGHAFLRNMDDGPYILTDPLLHALTVEHLVQILSQFYLGNYAPLHLLSYALDLSLWGERPGPMILENGVLHAACGLLFSGLVVRLTGNRLWAFAAMLVFLLHPVQVESVAWISQRKTLLAMLFTLAAFHAYLSYRQAAPRRRRAWYALALLAFIAALLAKSVAVIFPVILAAYDLCGSPRPPGWRWLADKLPFVVLAGLFAMVGIVGQAPETGGGRVPYHGGGPLATALTMLTVLPRYLGLLAWPSAQSVLYLVPIHTSLDAAVAVSLLLWLALAAAGVLLWRRARALFFWYAVFFIGLLPVSQIVPLITLMNDRYLYFPMLGAAALAGAAVAAAALQIRGQTTPLRRSAGFGLAVAAGTLFAAMASTSRARVAVWENDLTLWTDTVQKMPLSAAAWYQLGHSYQDVGRDEEALEAYRRAVTYDPTAKDARANLAGYLIKRRELPEALALLEDGVRLNPDYFELQYNLGLAYSTAHDFAAAELPLKRAVALRPTAGQAHALLGDVYLRTRRLELARDSYRQAALSGADSAVVEINRAAVAGLAGEPAAGLAFLETALGMGFRNAAALANNVDLAPLRAHPGFAPLVARYLGDAALARPESPRD